ncbi:MAG TPA: PIN domain-containing protein [Pseudonocardiaceae bacterium]|nr:PIN domain-containing protein [Pseudonocardiaceae bacterium]
MSSPGSEVCFVDTNVLLYAQDKHDPDKYRVSRDLLEDLWTDGVGIVSTQVLQEFYSVATRKLRPPMTPSEARDVVVQYIDWCRIDTDPLLILSASHLAEEHTVNFWDALIVEAALRAGATELVTEDLQDGREFGALRVRNPFKTQS